MQNSTSAIGNGDDNNVKRPLKLLPLLNSWRRRAVALVLVIVLAISIAVPFIKPASAATTVSTSTSGSATQYSQQRKTWYDGTRYWVGFYDGTNIIFYYSANGTSWTQDTSATISDSGVQPSFSIEGDSSNLFVAYEVYTTGGLYDYTNVYARKALSYPGMSFSWGAANNISQSGNNEYSLYPSITRDTNDHVQIMYWREASQTWVESKKSSVANDVTSANFTVQAVTPSSVVKKTSITQSALSGDNIYSTWVDGANISGSKETGSTWDTKPTPIAAGSSSQQNDYKENVSMVSSTSANEAYMSYIDSGGKIQFRKYEDSNGAASTAIGSSLGAIPAGTGRNIVRDSSGNIYVGVNANGTCEIYKSTNDGSSFAEVDSAHHPSCVSGAPVALAIDANDNLHFVFLVLGGQFDLEYVVLSSGSYGTPEAAIHDGVQLTTLQGLDIAIDSSNIPHVIEATTTGNVGPTSSVYYSNRIGGSWNTTGVAIATVSGSQKYFGTSISFASNTPVVSYIDTTVSTLKAAIGNANNAASFTNQSVDTSVNTVAGQAGTSIGIDPTGNTWVAYTDATGTNQINLIEHKVADAWSTWQTAVTDTKTGSEPSLAVAGNMIYLLYKNSTGAIAQDVYNADTASWSGENVIQSGTTLQNAHVRWAMNADNKNKSLGYLYSDGTDIYYNQAGVWRAPVALDTNSGNAYTSISIDTVHNNDLYIFWERSNVIYYKKCVSPYLAANCDAAATTKYTGGSTVAWVSATASRSSGFSLPLIWTEGSGSPYSVKYDSIALNFSPNAPTLTSPSSGTHILSTTPSLQMSATDPDGDAVKYKALIYNTSANNGATCSGSSFETGDQTSVGTGWNNGTTAYTSGATATYAVQATMTRGNSYCWQAQAIDPGGTNTFGSLSTPSTVTINNVPGAPTLSAPSSGQTDIPLTPELRLYSIDSDNDYLRYQIILYDSNCSTQTQTGTGTYDQNVSQTGWSGQSVQSGTAYTAGQTAIYKIQTALAANTQYCWKAAAKDPAGTNTFGSFSSTQAFTTQPATKPQVNIHPQGGDIKIYSGTSIGG